MYFGYCPLLICDLQILSPILLVVFLPFYILKATQVLDFDKVPFIYFVSFVAVLWM